MPWRTFHAIWMNVRYHQDRSINNQKLACCCVRSWNQDMEQHSTTKKSYGIIILQIWGPYKNYIHKLFRWCKILCGREWMSGSGAIISKIRLKTKVTGCSVIPQITLFKQKLFSILLFCLKCRLLFIVK